MSNFDHEVKKGDRFTFGKNWSNFLAHLNEERIIESEKHIKQYLELEDLTDKTFIDVGSGSGLSSLAAKRLGAKVYSFDYDPHSVNCTKELKRRYFEDDPSWTVNEGSALDDEYIKSLGKFDVVYSWGVLHHTGDMWKALNLVDILVKSDHGVLYLSIYNDQGSQSIRWRKIKKIYNSLPGLMKLPYTLLVMMPRELRFCINPLLLIRPKSYFYTWKAYINSWRNYKKSRGMSRWHDLVDWVGGYPFEVAKPEEIFNFFNNKGYTLKKLKTCGGGLGCNEYVFTKHSEE